MQSDYRHLFDMISQFSHQTLQEHVYKELTTAYYTRVQKFTWNTRKLNCAHLSDQLKYWIVAEFPNLSNHLPWHICVYPPDYSSNITYQCQKMSNKNIWMAQWYNCKTNPSCSVTSLNIVLKTGPIVEAFLLLPVERPWLLPASCSSWDRNKNRVIDRQKVPPKN